MVGRKQFDETAVLDRIMDLFWQQGYEATSIDDLSEATGLRRGSLYNAFGDKETMFLAALDRYAAVWSQPTRSALSETDPKLALERFFDAHVARMADPYRPRGCFESLTGLEAGSMHRAITEKVAEQLRQTEEAVHAALERAQITGAIGPDRDIRSLAVFFVGVVQGMAVLNKAFGDAAMVREVARQALAVLDEPG